MKVIIVGCRGVGIETAKNLALQGVGAITLVDSAPTQLKDTGGNFFLFESDAASGMARAAACAPRLQELNPICEVRCEEALSTELIKAHNALVVTQFKPLPELMQLDAFCRENRVGFFYAYTGGVCASVFVDLGPHHVVNDKDGERPIKKLITDIQPHPDGGSLVRYDTPDGGEAIGIDTGFFEVSEVQGVDGINAGVYEVSHDSGKDPAKTLRVPFSSSLPYLGGGILTEKKVPQAHPMQSLADKLLHPGNTWDNPQTLVQTDLLAFSEVQQHVAFVAVSSFASKKGFFPRLGEEGDCAECVEIAQGLLLSKEIDAGEGFEVDAAIVTRLARHASAELQPMCAFVGGVLAQEVVKCTGKFTPIPGFMHFSAPEVLAEATPREDTQPRGHRNDDLAAVLGWTFCEKLSNLRYFMVGCGALGCEFMKNFALNGIFCGPHGQLIVTDADRIELSNLSRQFLFREHNVGQPKSRAAAAMATVMNPGFKVEALELFVGTKSEDKFNDDFWMALDGVCNALDNMEARLYVDQQCVKYEKSLLESGTMGTSGNIDTISPHKTQTYRDGGKAAEGGGVPMCTLRNFPHLTDHCIEWSRDQFALLFVKLGKSAEAYLADPEAFEEKRMAEAEFSAASFDILSVLSLLQAAKSPSMEAAAQLAFDMFHYLFRDRILLLQQQHPQDSRMIDDKTKKDVGPFWSEKKRYPTALEFNLQDDAHTSFLLSATCLFAVLLGVVPPKKEEETTWLAQIRPPDRSWIRRMAAALKVPEYTPAPAPARDEDREAAKKAVFSDMLGRLRREAEGLMLPAMEVQEFEKDDDANCHIEFTTACANLRCDNYDLKRTDFQACKVIAGKIIAAIATTTAAVCGLVLLELFKLVQGKGTDDLMNRQIGLGTNVYTSFSQEMPKKHKTVTERVAPDTDSLPAEAFDAAGKIKDEYFVSTVRMAYPEGHTVWDKIECSATMTLKQFNAWLLTEHGVKFSSWAFIVGTKLTEDSETKVWAPQPITTAVYPPPPVLDHSLLPSLDLAKGQAMQALMKTPAASRAVQKYLALWEESKKAGSVPPQPVLDPRETITEASTMRDILRRMAALGDEWLAQKKIDSKTIAGLDGRRFWVIRTAETGPATLVHAESDEDIAQMAAIKFVF